MCRIETLRCQTHTRSREKALTALLLATNSGLTYAAARCLAEVGSDYAVLATGRYPAVSTSRRCRSYRRFPKLLLERDDPALMTDVLRVMDEQGLHVVVPTGIAATLYLGRHQDRLSSEQVFPLSSDALIEQLHDKWWLSQLLERLGLPYPETHLVTGVDDVGDIPLPVVVKPIAAEASAGIWRADSRRQLTALLEGATARGDLPLLVQRYVAGADMAVSVLADHGRIVTCAVQQPGAGGTMHYLRRPDAVAIATAIVKATGFHGVAVFDMRHASADDSVYVLECNPRLFSSANKLAYAGVNLVDLGLRISRGEHLQAIEPPVTEVGDTLIAFRTRNRGRLNAATNAAVRAETQDPLSALFRALEWRLPTLSDRISGEAAPRPEPDDLHRSPEG